MSLKLEVVEDPARSCAAMMLSTAVDEGHIVLAGGSTPEAAYREFIRVAKAVDADLAGTTFWFGDERCVPPDDERSNYGMVQRAMLSDLEDAGPGPTVHRMKGELGPTDAALDYERELEEAGQAEFELVLLGIGPDGHTASLFPEQPALAERSRLVVGVEHAGLEPFVPRVTLTLPALSRGKRIVFLIAGESKAQAVAAAFGPNASPDPRVPASLLVPLAEEIVVLLDPAAANRL